MSVFGTDGAKRMVKIDLRNMLESSDSSHLARNVLKLNPSVGFLFFGGGFCATHSSNRSSTSSFLSWRHSWESQREFTPLFTECYRSSAWRLASLYRYSDCSHRGLLFILCFIILFPDLFSSCCPQFVAKALKPFLILIFKFLPWYASNVSNKLVTGNHRFKKKKKKRPVLNIPQVKVFIVRSRLGVKGHHQSSQEGARSNTYWRYI